ncbi:MAG: acyltransferase family protein [Prevotella sp.]|nr:acyltransferase family protein [Prevotella sp.]
MNNKRIVWVDYAKILGLITVIFAHLYTIKGTGEDNVIRTYIYGFHMPFFFFISGCLFKERIHGFKEAVVRNIKSLLVPYIVFNIIFAIVYGIVDGNVIQRLITIPLHWAKGEGNACKASWFVICLFNIKMIIDVLYYKKTLYLGISIIFILSLAIVYSGFRHNWLFCSSTIFGSVFYFLGMMGLRFLRKIHLLPWLVLGVSIGFFLISFFLTQYNGKVSMYGADTGNSWIVFYLNSMVGSIGIIFLGMMFKKERPFVVLLSNSSLGIVLLHMGLVDLFKAHLVQFTNSYIFFLLSLVVSLLIYCVCSFLYQKSMKYVPFIWGKF